MSVLSYYWSLIDVVLFEKVPHLIQAFIIESVILRISNSLKGLNSITWGISWVI